MQTNATAAATQRALDAALSPLPLTPLPDVYEWHGEPARDLWEAANRGLTARADARHSQRRFTGAAVTGFGELA